MSNDLSRIFNDFDRGVLSRRQLLQALGIAALVQPASAFAQGQCGGAKKGTPECDPTPAKAPFAPTGWKTVMLDHLSCQVADYSKEAAYYAARAMAVDPEDPMVLYNVACSFSILGKTRDALDALEKAVNFGWGDKGWLEHDSDLDPLRKDPRYIALLGAM